MDTNTQIAEIFRVRDKGIEEILNPTRFLLTQLKMNLVAGPISVMVVALILGSPLIAIFLSMLACIPVALLLALVGAWLKVSFDRRQATLRLIVAADNSLKLEHLVGLRFDDNGLLKPGYHYKKKVKPASGGRVPIGNNFIYLPPSSYRPELDPLPPLPPNPATCSHEWMPAPNQPYEFCRLCSSINALNRTGQGRITVLTHPATPTPKGS